MSGWPRTPHRHLILPQEDTIDWDAISPQVLGDQLESLGSHCNLVMQADIDADVGSFAAIDSSGAATFASWTAARLAARNAALAGQPALFALAGIVSPTSIGTDGMVASPAAVDDAGDLDISAADDVMDGLVVARRPIGFFLSDSLFFDGARPLAPLPHMRVRPLSRYGQTGLTVWSRTFAGGKLQESGAVAPGTPGQFHVPFLVPADFAGWHEGAGEAAIAAWAYVRMTGTLSCSLKLADTTGTESSAGSTVSTHGADVRVTIAASLASGLTFTPGDTAHLVVTFAPGASGGTATLYLPPVVRYQPLARSNL